MVHKEEVLDPKEANEAIVLVQMLAADQGFVAVLAGGVALQVYGSRRFTNDVDFVLSGPPLDLGPFRKIRPIGFGGSRVLAPNGVKVDLIVREDEYEALYVDAIKSAVVSTDGIPVVTVEHLAVMKFAAGREKDIQDLKWIIRQPRLLSLQKAKGIVYKFFGRFGQDRFEDIVDQALIEQEMMRRRSRDPEEE